MRDSLLTSAATDCSFLAFRFRLFPWHLLSATALIQQSFGQTVISINTTVAEKRPMSAGDVDLGEIHGDDQHFLAVDAGAGQDLAGGTSHETLAPEFETISADW